MSNPTQDPHGPVRYVFEAIEAKLKEQRKFVLWWDGQEKQERARGIAGPGRGNKTALQTSNAVLPKALVNVGIGTASTCTVMKG